MCRIAFIGAGSIVFCKTLMLDIMAVKELGEVEFVLMAPSTRKTAHVKEFADRVIRDNHLSCTVEVTTDRRAALKGADYVVATYQIGGTEAGESDYAIPMRYGVDQCIGDTLGPGGIFRALRTIPTTCGLARDMEELCPGALLLNYVNPMAMICWALSETKVQSVGLCHGVQTTLGLIAGYLDLPAHEIDYACAGINHMAWFTKIEHRGKDMYPLLRERFELPEYYANEKVRGEVFRHFGYFMTESTGHLSEYLPYFRKNERALSLYCDEPSFGGESGANVKWVKLVDEKYRGKNMLEGESTLLPPRSVEYGSYIIEALELNRPFRFNGNLRNNGLISNLPGDCTAEVTVFADGAGLHPTYAGPLPVGCAALCTTNILVQRLAVQAALTGDTELIVQACALDPLTSAKLTLAEIRDMAADLLEAQRPWQTAFAGRAIRRTPLIPVTPQTIRAEVPVDPALAIYARLGKLGESK